MEPDDNELEEEDDVEPEVVDEVAVRDKLVLVLLFLLKVVVVVAFVVVDNVGVMVSE